jgi:carbon monoxide dehydrogenase subunit G
MDMEKGFSIATSIEHLWAALNNIALLRKCIPDCEVLEWAGDDEMRG